MDLREMGLKYVHQIDMEQVDSYEHGNKCRVKREKPTRCN